MCQVLLDASLLSPAEVAWLDAYHADCAASLAPLLASDARATAWLRRHTQPLAR
jgi:Xaa-Pro aminopeptidase